MINHMEKLRPSIYGGIIGAYLVISATSSVEFSAHRTNQLLKTNHQYLLRKIFSFKKRANTILEIMMALWSQG